MYRHGLDLNLPKAYTFNEYLLLMDIQEQITNHFSKIYTEEELIEKYNPYHDRLGRFTTAPNAVSGIDIEKNTSGGRYGYLKKINNDPNYEIHHIPSASISGIHRNMGPAVKLRKEDHEKTLSYGNSKKAQEYRAKQEELIKKGNFYASVLMDIVDIWDKFGDKYDKNLYEMLEYINKLKELEVI